MSGFFMRIAQRVLGGGVSLRPATNRYLIALQPREHGILRDPSVDEHTLPPQASRSDVRPLRSDPREPRSVSPQFEKGRTEDPPHSGGALVDSSPSVEVPLSVAALPSVNTSPLVATPLLNESRPKGAVAPPSPRDTPLHEAEHVAKTPIGAGNERLAPAAAPQQRLGEPRLLPLERPARFANGGGLTERSGLAQRSELPPVHVHIGRVDVRAISAPQPKAPPARTPMRKPSLAEHLRARERGAG